MGTSRQQKTLGTLRWTLIRSRTRLGPSMDPTGPLIWTSKFSSLFQAVFAVSTLNIIAPLTMLEHFCGHYGTLPRAKGPSLIIMDPKMDPIMDPAMLIPGNPL